MPEHDFDLLWAMQPTAFTLLMGTPPAAAPAAVPAAALADTLSSTPATPLYELDHGVAVIPVEGALSRANRWGGVSYKAIGAALDQALTDPAVRAVLLSIHSPGGTATGVKELSDAIFAARRIKPCAAWVDGLACSAAYWLASATGAVYAGPSSEVGSIGVLMRHMDKSGLNAQLGLAYTYVTAGSLKAVGNPDSALSEQDRNVLQGRVDALYEMFCGDVAQRMGLALENRETWADGRDFLAAEAQNLGLVTALVSSRAEAIQHLFKETRMDKTELAKAYPDLLASIQGEAAEAARQEAQTAVETALSLMETVCGAESAAKVRSLVATGMTPAQLQAAANALALPQTNESGANAMTTDSTAQNLMLAAIKNATPAPVTDGGTPPRDDVVAAIARIGAL